MRHGTQDQGDDHRTAAQHPAGGSGERPSYRDSIFKGDLPAGDTDLTFEAGNIHGQDMFAGWKLLELPFPIQRQIAPLGLGEELLSTKSKTSN